MLLPVEEDRAQGGLGDSFFCLSIEGIDQTQKSFSGCASSQVSLRLNNAIVPVALWSRACEIARSSKTNVTPQLLAKRPGATEPAPSTVAALNSPASRARTPCTCRTSSSAHPHCESAPVEKTPTGCHTADSRIALKIVISSANSLPYTSRVKRVRIPSVLSTFFQLSLPPRTSSGALETMLRRS